MNGMNPKSEPYELLMKMRELNPDVSIRKLYKELKTIDMLRHDCIESLLVLDEFIKRYPPAEPVSTFRAGNTVANTNILLYKLLQKLKQLSSDDFKSLYGLKMIPEYRPDEVVILEYMADRISDELIEQTPQQILEFVRTVRQNELSLRTRRDPRSKIALRYVFGWLWMRISVRVSAHSLFHCIFH